MDDEIECTCGSDYRGYEKHSYDCEAGPDYMIGDKFL